MVELQVSGELLAHVVPLAAHVAAIEAEVGLVDSPKMHLHGLLTASQILTACHTALNSLVPVRFDMLSK